MSTHHEGKRLIFNMRQFDKKKFTQWSHDSSSKLTNADDSFIDNKMRADIALWKKLLHENILLLIEVIHDPALDLIFIITEDIDGSAGASPSSTPSSSSLSHHLLMKPGAVPMEVTKKVFYQIMSSLHFLHSSTVAHHDINPKNILVTKDGIVKLTGFGLPMYRKDSRIALARELRFRLSSCDSTLSPPLPSDISLIESVSCMAPEMLMTNSNSGCDGASSFNVFHADLWAAACTLYYYHYGALPFVGASLSETVCKIKEEPVALPVETDFDLKDILSQMLHKDPSGRLTSIDQIKASI